MTNFYKNYYNTRLLITTLIGTIIVFLILRTFDEPLRTSAAPAGIVSFELAKTISNAVQILDSWNESAKINAALSLGIDYLFLFCYAFFLSISIYTVTVRLEQKNILIKMGNIFATLMLIAGIFDAIENFALISIISGSINEFYPTIAYYCASFKFILIAGGILFLLYIIFLKFFNRYRFRKNRL